MTSLLIVDDLPQVRQSLRTLLHLVDHFQVIGDAATGQSALQLAEQIKPDIVLVDLLLPDLDGFELTRLLKARRLTQAVIVVTIHHDLDTEQRALRAGADAFVAKVNAAEQLIETIEWVRQNILR